MSGLFYPYRGAADALAHLGPYADTTIGRGCGISYTDGQQICVLRRPARGQRLWLNVWRRHVASPRPAPSRQGATGFWQNVGHFFEHAIELYGESEYRRSQADMAASQALVGAVDRHIWQPTHQWLLKHKLWADTIAVTADVVGVVAGVVVIIVAGPELAVGAAIVGGTAIVGSAVLALIDGTVLGFELAGQEETVKTIESNEGVQWARIIGTVMTLPDMAVGGVQAVRDISRLPTEINDARAVSRSLTEAAQAKRAEIAKVPHPAKNPHKIQQIRTRANKFTRAAADQAKNARKAARVLKAARLGATGSYGATPTGAALLATLPPDILLSEEQMRRDERAKKLSLTPQGGMPRNIRLDMRVSGVTKVQH